MPPANASSRKTFGGSSNRCCEKYAKRLLFCSRFAMRSAGCDVELASPIGRRLQWLLLGEAMEGAEAPNQFGAIDGNDAARGEKFSERCFRDRVVRIIEDGKENRFVCDVEVRVAGG